MEEYKNISDENNPVDIEEDPKDDAEISSTQSTFISLLEELESSHEKKNREEEFEILREINRKFTGDYSFPVNAYFDANFINILTDFLTEFLSSMNKVQQIYMIELIDSVIREDKRLLESFAASPIFDAFLSSFIEDDDFTDRIFVIIALTCICETGKEKIIAYDDNAVLNKICMLANQNSDNVDKCMIILSYCIPSINPENTEFINFLLSFFVEYISADNEIISVNTYNTIDDGLQKILSAFPFAIETLVNCKIMERIDNMLQKYGPLPDEKCIELTKITANILLTISAQKNQDDEYIIFGIVNIPSFIDTMSHCCMHCNADVAKRSLGAVANLIGTYELEVSSLIDNNFPNGVLTYTLQAGNYEIKENAMMCVYQIARVSEPDVLMNAISPELLETLISSIIDYGKGKGKNWIKVIGTIVNKITCLGLNDTLRSFLQTQEFYDFLSECFDEYEDDEKMQAQLNIIGSALGFIEGDYLANIPQ